MNGRRTIGIGDLLLARFGTVGLLTAFTVSCALCAEVRRTLPIPLVAAAVLVVFCIVAVVAASRDSLLDAARELPANMKLSYGVATAAAYFIPSIAAGQFLPLAGFSGVLVAHVFSTVSSAGVMRHVLLCALSLIMTLPAYTAWAEFGLGLAALPIVGASLSVEAAYRHTAILTRVNAPPVWRIVMAGVFAGTMACLATAAVLGPLVTFMARATREQVLEAEARTRTVSGFSGQADIGSLLLYLGVAVSGLVVLTILVRRFMKRKQEAEFDDLITAQPTFVSELSMPPITPRKRFGKDPRAQLMLSYFAFLRLMKRDRQARADWMTADEYRDVLRGKMPSVATMLNRLTGLFVKARYTDQPIAADDVSAFQSDAEAVLRYSRSKDHNGPPAPPET